jgi:hypothetical protein
MTRKVLIKHTVDNIEKLSDQKLQEASDFIEFLLNKIETDQINLGIQNLVQEGNAFQFLHDEEDIYTVSDLKEIYKK